MNRLVLIDGNAILHRAYHALPPLTAPDGSVVNAVYGFASMLFKIVNDIKPTHVAVAFDRAAPTFRKEMFKAYQATRPKMEEALVSQIDKVHDLIAAFGIPVYEKDGFEADDVIGTICQQVNSKSIDQIIIVTGDRDILQLVEDEKVLVFMPTKGLSEGKLYGEKEVVERMGVKPSQIADYKALAGDPSDNYPGVAGIGPKTAAALILQFGNLEQLYKGIEEHEAEVSETVLNKLKAGEENAELSQQLATIRTDAPVEFDIHKARKATLDTPDARKALEDLHFSSLLKRLTGGSEQGKEKKDKKQKSTGQQQLF